MNLPTSLSWGIVGNDSEYPRIPLNTSSVFAVDSLLKYTGYGNAAGLLAARGLLAGGRGDNWYSEDEDTDTEEYKNAKPKYSIKFLFT